MNSAMWIVSGAIGWLAVLPPLAGAIVCLLHVGRSRRVPLLLAGFGLDLAAGVVQRAGTMLLGSVVSATPNTLGALFAVTGAAGLLANALVVWGVAGLLHDLRARPAAGVEPAAA